MVMRIELDDLTRPQVHALLEEHLKHMFELSPPEQVFALDLSKLRMPEISFWTVWDGEQLLSCGALKQLSPVHGEIKSMRTPANARGKGAGRAVLAHIIAVARQRGYETLSLDRHASGLRGCAPALRQPRLRSVGAVRGLPRRSAQRFHAAAAQG
jgi:putative acetyltransferase